MSDAPAIPRMQVIVSDDAYSHYPGPILVLAGPGTGKTYQLAKRIQFLTTELHAAADEITVITFTQEAAQSMRKKLQEKGQPEFVAEDRRPGIISTMHSLGHKIIEENLREVGLSADFKVLEREELRKIVFIDAALRVNESEDQGLLAFEERRKGKRQLSDVSRKIGAEYERLLRACNYIDFDDQIGLACELLSQHDRIGSQWRGRARYLLVDEFQDINSAQFELICLLSASAREGLFVVGDDDQSIYHFRGGSPEFIRKFQEHFGPQAKIIQMKTSRRCKRNILSAANHVVARHDPGRVPKLEPTFIETEPGEVFVHGCPSDDREAVLIASFLKREMEEVGGDSRGAFILIPSRLYLEKLESALTSAKIGFSAQVGKSKAIDRFLLVRNWAEQRPEGESTSDDLLAREVTHLVIESGRSIIPSSRMSSAPKVQARSEGLKTIAGVWDRVVSKESNFCAELERIGKTNHACQDLFEKLNLIQKAYESEFGEFLKLVADYVKPWTGKREFFRELDYIERSKRRPPQLGNFSVRIMTMQSSKGLQAHSVYVVGLEEGKLPSGGSQSEVAEEARLLFVAMTRAKDKLHLFHARKREGSISLRNVSHQLQESRFVKDLPIPKENRKYHPSVDKLKMASRRRSKHKR